MDFTQSILAASVVGAIICLVSGWVFRAGKVRDAHNTDVIDSATIADVVDELERVKANRMFAEQRCKELGA